MLCLRAATAWSKWTDSNRHHRAWKARILPLDHTCLSEPKARVELASPSYQDGALSLELHRHRPARGGARACNRASQSSAPSAWWSDRDSNPDLWLATPGSSHWTITPFGRSARI